MDFEEDFDANVSKHSSQYLFCFRGQDHPLKFNQCLPYFDSLKLSGMFK